MQVSIIIVNYNVRDLLMNAVASLYTALEGIESEIIVVDNASTDGAIEALNLRYPRVITIKLDQNLGFGAANNIGIERSAGEYVLLINPDTIVQEDTIRTMIGFMQTHPDAAVAGCKILNPDGSFEPASKRGFPSPWSSFCRVFGLSRLFPHSKLFGGYNLTHIDPDTTTTVDALSGCFMFFSGTILRELHGFDTDFFMYGEDLDICFRARQVGGGVYYHPATSIIHLKGESTRRSSLDALAMFYHAMDIFARKHFRRNAPLLWLIHAGIRLRKGIARFNENFPKFGYVVVDIAGILIGFAVGSLMRFGSLTGYPDYAYPAVILLPPVVFILTIAIAGGYGSGERSIFKALVGYLVGFFILSTLPYFFQDYAFSRGVVLVTTSIATVAGLAARFGTMLFERTFGARSIRRIAFLGRQDVRPGLRNRVRRTFFGRPVTFTGIITPTFSELDAIGDAGLGTVENIAKIIRRYGVTDIFVMDATLSYGDVIKALGATGGLSVRFHIVRGEAEDIRDTVTPHDPIFYKMGRPHDGAGASTITKRLYDRLLALAMLFIVLPGVYLTGKKPVVRGNELLDALIGRRPMVGGGTPDSVYGKAAIFTAVALYRDESLTRTEIAQVEDYYAANRSFLLDCELIISSLRLRNMPERLRHDTAGETVRHWIQ